MRETILILVVVATFGAVEGLFQLSRYLQDRRVEDLRRRLRSLGGDDDGSVTLLRPGRMSAWPPLDVLLRRVSVAAKLESLLAQADLSMNVAQFLGLSGVVGFAGALAAMVLGSGGPMLAVFAAGGAVVPMLVLVVRRDRRSAKLSEQLPDALDMVSRALRAGYAVPNSFQLVAAEMPGPINLEFGRAYEEQRLGRSIEDAVLEITRRVPANGDLKILAVSILVQKETGGNLTEILDSIAETIRARYRFYGKLRALTAEGRMSGMVLGCLPLGMMAFLLVVNPHYVEPLWKDPIGWLFLAYAIGSWSVGLFWMFSMTKVRY